MRICHVINNLAGGGAEKLLVNISSIQIDERYHEVSIICLNRIKNKYEQAVNPKIKLIFLTNRSKFNPYIIYRLYKVLKRIDPQVIHVHLFPSMYYSFFVNMILHIPMVYHEHSTTNNRMNISRFEFFERFIYAQYQTIIAASDSIRLKLLEYLSNDSEINVLAVNNGILLNKNILPKSLGLKIKYSIIIISRFSIEKDHRTIILASKYLDKNCDFHFFGDGPLQSEVQNLASNEGLDRHNYIFHGFRDNLQPIINKMDLSILSSKWEGFGLAALETMSFGLPTIGTEVDGLSSVIGSADMLFKVGDYLKLAEIVNKLLSNDEFYSNCSKIAIDRSKMFDLKTTVSEIDKIYLDILEQT